MMNYPIQIILTRQLAAHLSVPVFLVNPKGDLLFYNEAAEAILGLRFTDTGEMPAEEWSSAFNPVDHRGKHVAPEALPLMQTLKTFQPAHSQFGIRGLNGKNHVIEVTSIPITGLDGEFLGAAALFWEHSSSCG